MRCGPEPIFRVIRCRTQSRLLLVIMLGRLLHSATSSFGSEATRLQPPLESTAEEAHTRQLLFPDCDSISYPQNPKVVRNGLKSPITAVDNASGDDRGGLDVNFPADVRIIIAQDASASFSQPQVLLDLDPPRPTTAGRSVLDPSIGNIHSRHALDRTKSLTCPAAASSPREHIPRASTGWAARQPPPSSRSPGSKPRGSFADGDAWRFTPTLSVDGGPSRRKASREAREETDALLACMFGAPGFRLEPSIKLHVIPQKPHDDRAPYVIGHGADPLVSKRLSGLRGPHARPSDTAETRNEDIPTSSGAHRAQKPRCAVMFTRLFTVDLQNTLSVDEPLVPPVESALGPKGERDPHPLKATSGTAQRDLKQEKTPMFAVAIILRLPPDAQGRDSHCPSSQSTLSSAASGSAHTPWSPSSFGNNMSSGVLEFHLPSTATKSQISQVLQQWEIFARTLDQIRVEAQVRLTNVLANQLVPPASSVLSVSIRDKRSKQPTQRSICAMPDCLQRDPRMVDFVKSRVDRLLKTLRTRRATIGQNRWGAWREEARWINRWATAHDRPSLLTDFLAAFLGTHQDWMRAFCSPDVPMQGPSTSRPSLTLGRPRTVVIAEDKMLARRLIFLASEFFTQPSRGQYQHACPFHSSLHCCSGSPPARSLEKKQGLGSAPITTDRNQNEQNASQSPCMDPSEDVSLGYAKTGSPSTGILSTSGSFKRAGSVINSVNVLAMTPPQPSCIRDASLSTATADSAIPVPFFAAPAQPAASLQCFSGSADSAHSLASISLTHNLRGSKSNSESVRGRWSSVMTGFWSAKSMDGSEATTQSPESLRGQPPEQSRRSSAGQLARMVEEASHVAEPAVQDITRRLEAAPEVSRPEQPPEGASSTLKALEASSRPHPRRTEPLPLDIFVNEEEGFVDITLKPGESLGSSLASSVASALRPHLYSRPVTSSNSPPSLLGSNSLHEAPGTPSDLAGWLPTFNSDFCVSGVRPYPALMTDIMCAMQTEARLAASEYSACDTQPGVWAEISVSLIADTTRRTVERLILRRRPRPGTELGSKATHVPERPRTSPSVEESFIVETVVEGDPILDTAVARIIGRGSNGSATHPVASSPLPHQSTLPHARTHASERHKHCKAKYNVEEDPTLGTKVHHEEYRELIWSALEQILGIVCEDMARGGSMRVEGILRTGIRRYLQQGRFGMKRSQSAPSMQA